MTDEHPDVTSRQRPERSGTLARRAMMAGAAVSVAIALAWVVLASLSPTTTYHFAPLVATIAAPALGRYRAGHALGIRSAVLLAVAGAAATSIAALALAMTGRLGGPTLWGTAGSAGETAAAIGIGVMIGLAVAVFSRTSPHRVDAAAEEELPPSN